jgi:hypothetical protein
MKTPSEIRKEMLAAMSRETNPNKTPREFSAVLGAVAGVSSKKVQEFIEGDDRALTDKELILVDTLS